jgi:mono/diheme cytochrome c family protein
LVRKSLLLAIISVVSVPFLLAAAGDGAWLTKVPEKDRNRSNPFASDPKAVAAGAKLFRQNCATCHGTDAMGKDHRPNLQSGRIRQATPGELHWLLTNGSLRNGMPSWSRLPEPQRWQIVSYLKDLVK